MKRLPPLNMALERIAFVVRSVLRWAECILWGLPVSKHCLLAVLVLACSSNVAMATCPLLDLVEYQGKTYPLAQYTNPPSSPKVSSWIRGLPWCSAPGQGRAVYRVDGDKVFLVKFRGCGSELNVSDAYEQSESKMPASWLTGKLDVALGNCIGGWDPAKESFVVRSGELVEFVKVP